MPSSYPPIPVSVAPDSAQACQAGSAPEQVLDQLRYVCARSSFYNRKYSGLGGEPEVLYARFFELPFTTKAELLSDQADCPPFGSYLAAPVGEVRRIHKTSGSTARPLLVALTGPDIKLTTRVGAKCFASSGLTSSDTVFHCLNYCMWAGGFTDQQSLEATGAAVVPFGVGNTRNLIEMVRLIQPTAIHCTPSYLSKLELVLRTEFALNPMDLGLKLGLFGAESGLQYPEFRSSIERRWGIRAMNANYGMADVLSMFGAECTFQNGLHFQAADVLFPELVDPATGESRTIAEGTVGELVLTHLCKEAQPLIRYRTRDIVQVLGTTCFCKQAGFRFQIMGRTDDMFVIRGLNVSLSSIEEVINRHLDQLNGTYQVLLSKTDPVENILIRLEIRPSAAAGSSLSAALVEEMRDAMVVTPDLVLELEGTLPRTEGKAKKVLRTL